MKRILSRPINDVTDSKRNNKPRAASPSGNNISVFSDDELLSIEASHAEGMSVNEIVACFRDRGEHLTEATFRKYVQLGLLPRSRRVGRKGERRGSRGVYPATSVRQLAYIRKLMNDGFTMEEIQRDFLFVRGDIQALERQLDRVFVAIEGALRAGDSIAKTELSEAREAGANLLQRLERVEQRVTFHARMARAAI